MTELGTAVPAQQTRQDQQQEPTALGVRRFAVPGFAAWPAQGSPKEEGKALRGPVPREAHAELTADTGRPDAVTAVQESNLGRIPELTPIRVGRMAATPSRSCAVRPASWRTTSHAPP